MRLPQTILLCLVVALLASSVHAIVPIDGFVNDNAGLFTTEETANLTAIAQTMYDSGRVQYAIVTVPDLEGMAIEDYSRTIAEGHLGNTAADNGLLLLIAPTEHQYRFEVGRGLEGTLNDAKIGRVGRTYLVPAFKQGEYGAGTISASMAIDQLTQGVEPAAMTAPESTGLSLETKIIIAWFILYLIVAIVAAVLRKQRNSKYSNAAEVVAWMMLGGRGGGGGLGGGGSGGGGFGGGSFGGGGASGGW